MRNKLELVLKMPWGGEFISMTEHRISTNTKEIFSWLPAHILVTRKLKTPLLLAWLKNIYIYVHLVKGKLQSNSQQLVGMLSNYCKKKNF